MAVRRVGGERQAWAVGRAETILSRTGGPTWTLQRGGPTPHFLFAVSTLASGETWAVGEAGTVIRYTNGSWSPLTTTFTANLFGVQMLSPSEIYIVGDHTIARCDSGSCAQVATPNAVLSGVYMTGSEQGWAVGTDGSIWRDNGGTWTQVSSPITLPLYFVYMDSPSHGWAGGGTSTGNFTPVLIEYSGGAWVDRSTTLPNGSPILYSMALAPGGAEGWAVGYRDFNNSQSNAILHRSGGAWTVDHTSQAASLSGVALDANGEASAIAGEIVGGIGVVAYHLAGGIWQRQAVPVEWCCQAGLSLVPGQGGWSVGPLGNILRYTYPGGVTPTATSTPAATMTFTPIPTVTAIATATTTATATAVATASATLTATSTLAPTVTATTTPCAITFTDVHSSDYFYVPVSYLYCHGAISGYSDGTFRPYNDTTRGQLCKIAVLAKDWQLDTHGGPHFGDVPASHPFYAYVETAFYHAIIAGYADGTFRPYANITRGQLSKVIVLAQAWQLDTHGGPHFGDVPANHPFYSFIETAYNQGIVSGYGDGNFRPYNNATRGQISKIVYGAITR